LEEFDPNPEKKQTNEDLSDNNLTPEVTDDQNSQVLDSSSESQTDNKYKNLSDKKDNLFKRIIENGFDGITTNPNYKLLALLIILLINLSLFFVLGNIGKDFLRNSGILS
tara:strand:- start:279 stop:608 length:330 start_codon:yes stop_codon:yes gene_type:complete